MDRSQVAVVIPAFNERETIRAVVRSVEQYGTPIVVDDASSDGTGAEAAAAGATVVRLASNGGYDKALDAGFAEANRLGMSAVVTIDGDGQHDPDSIGSFLSELAGGADLVVGIRPHKARIAEGLFALMTRARYGLSDPLCGLKAYRIELYQSLGHFDRRDSVGTELMFHGLRNGFRLRQIRIPLRPRDGESRFGQSFQANLKILRAILNMWR